MPESRASEGPALSMRLNEDSDSSDDVSSRSHANLAVLPCILHVFVKHLSLCAFDMQK